MYLGYEIQINNVCNSLEILSSFLRSYALVGVDYHARFIFLSSFCLGMTFILFKSIPTVE